MSDALRDQVEVWLGGEVAVVEDELARSTADRYSDEQKDYAFNLWCYVCSRSATKTGRLLADPEHAPLTGVTGVVDRKTVQYWRDTLGWEARADKELYGINPHLRFRAKLDLVASMPESVAFVKALVQGDFDHQDPGVVKNKLTAAIAIMDRTGLSPNSLRTDLGVIEAPAEVRDTTAREFLKLSPEELEEESERQMRSMMSDQSMKRESRRSKH